MGNMCSKQPKCKLWDTNTKEVNLIREGMVESNILQRSFEASQGWTRFGLGRKWVPQANSTREEGVLVGIDRRIRNRIWILSSGIPIFQVLTGNSNLVSPYLIQHGYFISRASFYKRGPAEIVHVFLGVSVFS